MRLLRLKTVSVLLLLYLPYMIYSKCSINIFEMKNYFPQDWAMGTFFKSARMCEEVNIIKNLSLRGNIANSIANIVDVKLLTRTRRAVPPEPSPPFTSGTRKKRKILCCDNIVIDKFHVFKFCKQFLLGRPLWMSNLSKNIKVETILLDCLITVKPKKKEWIIKKN